jgi:peptide-methionine (S)-S-oxide reductase
MIKNKDMMWRIGIVIFTLFLMKGNSMGQSEKVDQAEVATFGGGCFWCVEAIFERVKGVESVESGYSGGFVKNPTYKQVTTGKTGHAEVVQIRFDPAVIGFTELLEIFFKTHDPTTLNRQGADVGTQYRSVVFYHNEAQRQQAEKVILELERAHIWKDPIVTRVEPFTAFYSAEEYHQEYFENNPNQGYCRVVIQPKVEKFEKTFQDLLKVP